MWTVTTSADDISHYGVKGMKWGVRKEYEPKGRKTSSFGDYSRYDELDEEFRKATARTRTIRNQNGTTEISITGSKTKEHHAKIIKDAIEGSDSYLYGEKAKEIFDKLPKKSSIGSEEFEKYAVNQNGPTTERLSNCFECSVATEMRHRGYDVQANTRQGGLGLEYYSVFDIKDSFSINSTSAEEAYNQVSRECLMYGEGARGSIGLAWPSGSGHAINWEVKNGEFILIDNQKLGRNTYEDFLNCDPTNIGVYRFDNADVYPEVVNYIEAYDGDSEEELEEKKKEEERKAKEEAKAEKRRQEQEKKRREEKERRWSIINYYKYYRKAPPKEAIKKAVDRIVRKVKHVTIGAIDKGKDIVDNIINKTKGGT